MLSGLGSTVGLVGLVCRAHASCPSFGAAFRRQVVDSWDGFGRNGSQGRATIHGLVKAVTTEGTTTAAGPLAAATEAAAPHAGRSLFAGVVHMVRRAALSSGARGMLPGRTAGARQGGSGSAQHSSTGWKPGGPQVAAATAAGAPSAAAVAAAAKGLRPAPVGPVTRGSRTLLPCGAGGRRTAAGRLVVGSSRSPSSVQIRTVWRDQGGYEHFANRGRAWPLLDSRARNVLLGFAAAGVGYYFWCLETVPYTGRWHSIMFVSPAMEKWLGEAVFEDITTLAASQGRLLRPDSPEVRRVTQLGQRIAKVASDGFGGGESRHMHNLEWQFVVIDDPMPNAMVLPGGKVIVYRGLLRLLRGNSNELAAVLAHEVGHVLARHHAERMSTVNLWQLLNLLFFLTFGFRLPTTAMYMGVLLPYSRRSEEEADLIGLRLMARACFDPMGAPTMLAKLNKVEQQAGVAARIPEFLRTHPLTENRVKRVEAELKEAYRLSAQSGCSQWRGFFEQTYDDWEA